MSKDLIKFNKKSLLDIAKKYDLNFLALFGSRANDTAREDSDYDLLYSSKKTMDYGDEVGLIDDLAREFKSAKIDLVSVNNASPLLLKEVYANSIVLAEPTVNSYDEFMIYAFMVYVEAKPLFRMKEEYLARHIG